MRCQARQPEDLGENSRQETQTFGDNRIAPRHYMFWILVCIVGCRILLVDNTLGQQPQKQIRLFANLSQDC